MNVSNVSRPTYTNLSKICSAGIHGFTVTAYIVFSGLHGCGNFGTNTSFGVSKDIHPYSSLTHRERNCLGSGT